MRFSLIADRVRAIWVKQMAQNPVTFKRVCLSAILYKLSLLSPSTAQPHLQSPVPPTATRPSGSCHSGTTFFCHVNANNSRDDVLVPWSLQCKDIVDSNIIDSVSTHFLRQTTRGSRGGLAPEPRDTLRNEAPTANCASLVCESFASFWRLLLPDFLSGTAREITHSRHSR